ncbi:winged helix-turn-helix domain-containing protein [Streptomyces sp. NPDC049879]|uniref:winged helix-turn-helix domain-containing protein n=1 Tax=Streptomyces sp. NPDC049879 TaxID=3365598 RepID=UPI0037AAE06F
MAGYAEIAGHFRQLISAGELRPGQQLPTVQEVMGTWDVSIATATRAYKVLRAEGLTMPAPGLGQWWPLAAPRSRRG